MTQRTTHPIAVGLAVTADEDFRAASLPLFEAGMVDALSWSFEATSGRPSPEWLELLVANP